MSTPKAKAAPAKRDGLNYKVELSSTPVSREGKKGPFVEAKAKTTIRGKEQEITIRAFANVKEGKTSEKSQKAMDALLAKKPGDKSNLYGRVVSWEDKEASKKGIFFQVLAVDQKPPVKAKTAKAPEGPQ